MIGVANEVIKLHNIFKSDSLRTRDNAQVVARKISKLKLSDEIIIDFAGINFASRSFLHELLTATSKFENVRFVNRNDDVELMFRLVQKPKAKIITKFTVEKPVTIAIHN